MEIPPSLDTRYIFPFRAITVSLPRQLQHTSSNARQRALKQQQPRHATLPGPVVSFSISEILSFFFTSMLAVMAFNSVSEYGRAKPGHDKPLPSLQTDHRHEDTPEQQNPS